MKGKIIGIVIVVMNPVQNRQGFRCHKVPLLL